MTDAAPLYKDCTDQEKIERLRRAVRAASFVLMPDGRPFMIMWRLYEQFGARHLETGEQYAIPYEDLLTKRIVPLLMCPVDLNLI